MKKILLAITVFFAGISMTQLSAQSRTNFGVKAEANMSNLLFDDMPGYKSDFGVGAGVGGFIKIDFGDYFAIQPELSVLWHNSTIKQSGNEHDFEYWGMEIPVYAVGQLKLDNGDRAYMGIGPYFGLGFSAKDKTADVNLYKENGGSDSFMQRGDIGAAAMIGYEFPFGMQINASYKYGLLDRLNAEKDDSSLRGQVITLGIGYRF